jgi:hypothetical protein
MRDRYQTVLCETASFNFKQTIVIIERIFHTGLYHEPGSGLLTYMPRALDALHRPGFEQREQGFYLLLYLHVGLTQWPQLRV